MSEQEHHLQDAPAKIEPHAQSVGAVVAAFDGESNGLSEAEAARRLELYGLNRLPEAPKRHILLRFLSHFQNLLIYVLLASAAITALLGHFIDTGVILAVVIVNAFIGFLQEGRAERAMDAVRQMIAPTTTVLRDAVRRRIDSALLVPGDIVLLEAGDRVPADLRLIEANGLRIDEAILTGESVPSEKDVAPVASDAPLGDRSAMAYSGTLVTGGTGRGIVVATGLKTEIGRITGMLSKVETITTPLVRQMNDFARWLTVIILLFAAVLLAYGYFVGQLPFVELFMIVVGLSVAAIPEGLPAVLTITLAVGVQAMARRNAIIRRLPAIETIGSVSVICTDKTGTLTRNEMMVASLVTANGIYAIAGDGYAPVGEVTRAGRPINPQGDNLIIEIARAAALCNDAVLKRDAQHWRIEGDPMEGALKALAGKLTLTEGEPFSDWMRVDTIPFDSSHRYMAVLNRDRAGRAAIYVKGAPEKVLAMCAAQRGAGGADEPLDTDYWQQRIEDIAAQGQRVLALAMLPLPQSRTSLKTIDLDGRLILLGITGLIDPPRPEAITAVAECHAAGIAVKMITGDHAGTAAAIARQIGLREPQRVITGAELERMNDAELAAIVEKTNVFARTSPEHKLRLVIALQSRGLTVAMTGDGVNDAPALKRADAGIAMGRKGSDAAKEASDLVLADDNFASIAAAVREGRTVYDNIKKVISWTLPTNAAEAFTIVAALFLGATLPITAVQILWVNLATSITLGLALAFEPTEEDTMRRPPRPRNAPLLTGTLVWHIVFVSMLSVAAVFGMFTYAVKSGYPIELARTMALNTLVVLEIFHLFFIRNIYGTSLTWKAIRGTKVIWICVITVTVLQFAITYLPPLQTVFGTRAVPFLDGVLIVMVGVVFFAIIEAEKQLRLHLRQPAGERGDVPTPRTA